MPTSRDGRVQARAAGHVEIERQIGQRSTISAGVDYVSGRSLIISINQNVPSCVATGTNNGCRPNPSYANNSQYSPSARSLYRGAHVSFVQRPAKWGEYRVSYTLSKAMSNVGEFFFSSPIDPFDLDKDWSRSDDDQRQRLVVNGSVTFYGFQLSGMMQAYSALPLNITSGVTTIQGTAGRPVVDGAFIPRNAGIGPDFFSVGMRLSHTFVFGGRTRLELLAEGFNLTNRMNVVTVRASGPAPTDRSCPELRRAAVGRRPAERPVWRQGTILRSRLEEGKKGRRMRAILLRLIAGLAIASALTGCGTLEYIPPAELSIDGRSNAHVTLAAEGRRLAAAWIASSDAGADVFASTVTTVDGTSARRSASTTSPAMRAATASSRRAWCSRIAR